MKREYSKPSMNIEVFQANEYIAACSKKYPGIPYDKDGRLYIENNGVYGYQFGEDTLLDDDIDYDYDDECLTPVGDSAKFQISKKGKWKGVYDVTYHTHIDGKEVEYHITVFTGGYTNAS